MLLARIQQDLFDFVDPDPDDFPGLLEFWYQANSEALSAALTAQPGLSLIVNVSSFQSFEVLAKKLFLVADTLVLRDTRKWTQDETGYRNIPIPTSVYRPGYYDDVLDELNKLRPSPLTLLYRPNLYLSSTTKTLNNGYHIAYAGWDYNSIPNEFLNWIAGSGRRYMKTGRVVYAPFIPSLEIELEFLRNGISLPDSFNATPCFHQTYDWLANDQLNALFSLKLPFLDGLDIDQISKIKEDHRDEFSSFSRVLLDSINGIKAALGTEEFLREVRRIQTNQIDAGLSDVAKTVKRLEAMSSLKKKGILVGLLGLNAAAWLGGPVPGILSGLAASGVAMVMEKAAQMKEQGELRGKSSYFLWKLQQEAVK